MRIVIVDDEQKALNLLKIIVERYPGLEETDEILTFQNSSAALEYLMGNRVDLVFLDIEMPGVNGLDIAQKLAAEKRGLPEVVFVTAYPQYSLSAWQLEAMGYIMKPFDTDVIYKALDKVQLLHPDLKQTLQTDKPKVVCSPYFNVFVNGMPIDFRHQKSREMLAFLIYNEGGWVPLEQMAAVLLEHAEEKSSKNYCRIILYRLKQALEQAGIPEIIESRHGKTRAAMELLDCDLQQPEDKTQGTGPFLSEYAWSRK